MKILFLSRWTPYPPDNGAKIRIFNSVRALAKHHDVSLLTFSEYAETLTTDQASGMRAYCSNLQVLPYRGFRPRDFRAIRAFVSPRPRSIVDTYNTEMAAAVQHELRRCRPDVVIASQIDMLEYASRVPRSIPAVLEELELSVYRDALARATTLRHRVRNGLTWLKLKAYIRNALPRFRACTVASDREWANVRAVAPEYGNVFVLPNAVDLESYDGEFGGVQPHSLVYSGALTYQANADAARHLVTDILPLIQARRPEVVLRITGNTGGVDLSWLERRAGVQLTGHVDDIRPVIARSSVAVVPLRVGGGTRLKILEAMALGTPVVSTSKGAEGLAVTHGENILIADTPSEFAQCTEDLLRSPELRQHLVAGGQRLVRARYDWQVVGTELRRLVESVAT